MSKNTSLLTNNQYIISFSKVSNTTLMAQECNIPGISLTHTEVGTPFSFIKEPDTKLRFNPFWMKFKLDENFDAYLDIYTWMRGLGFPESFDEYPEYEANRRGNKIFGDITISIYNNSSMPNIDVTLYNAFPIDLSDIGLSTTELDSTHLQGTAVFEYEYSRIARSS